MAGMVPPLETPRFALEPRTLADVEACVAMDSDIEVRRYITPAFRDHFDADTYRATLAERIGRDAGPGLGAWTIRPSADRATFLGMVLLIPVAMTGPEVEIGWRLPRSSWGQGMATEAATRVLRHAFETLALAEVIALIHPENRRSNAVGQRLGFLASGRMSAYGTEFDRYRLTQTAWSRGIGDRGNGSGRC
jgi:RimJ/RimL family protein N-acetyltransferase